MPIRLKAYKKWELFSKLKRANAPALKLNGGIFGEGQVYTFDRRISP
jgi:hypothetical protein